jgi:methylenetetrahydrofolate reductase (NADPH)
MDRARRHDVKILAGILLLISAKGAMYLTANVPGIFVPEPLVDEMATADKGKGVETGIKIAGRLIRQIREQKLCDGVHIMAINRENRIPEILRAAE